MTLPEVRQHLAQLNLQKAAETALATQVEMLAKCASAAGANGDEVWTGETVTQIGCHSAALRGRERGEVGMPPSLCWHRW